MAAGVAGNVLEWYDFALYGYLAPVFAPQFFPDQEPVAALIDSYIVFALGFVARPVGGLIFGRIGDRLGRRTLLALSVALMAVPTFLIGCLPTYASVGMLAPILLAGLRLVQGFSTGGEFAGSIVFLVEQAPPHRRGLYGSIANSGAMVGGVLGGAVGWLTASVLSPDALSAWGWRIPFLTGLLVGAFGLWIRTGVPDSPEFEKLHEQGGAADKPLGTALREHGHGMILTALLNWVASVGYYVVFVWLVDAMVAFAGLSQRISLAIGTAGLAAGLLATLAMGAAADRLGFRRMLVAGAVATALLCIPLLMLGLSGSVLGATAGQLGLAVLAATFLGTLPAVYVDLNGAAMRCTTLALSYNATLALFGGTAPLAATVLVKATGWSAAPGLYLAATAILCGVLARHVPSSGNNAGPA